MPMDPPIDITARSSFNTIIGVMEDNGRLPGFTALASAPTASQALGVVGSMEKSSISLFSAIPVPGTVILEPNSVFIVCVMATALPLRAQMMADPSPAAVAAYLEGVSAEARLFEELLEDG